MSGTEGAAYRRQQMARQLPEHDQDPNKCHELSPAEVKQMEQYVRKYKDEALGVGDVCLPEEIAQAAGQARAGSGPGTGPGTGPGSGPGVGLGLGPAGGGSVGTVSAAGAMGPGAQQNYVSTFLFVIFISACDMYCVYIIIRQTKLQTHVHYSSQNISQ